MSNTTANNTVIITIEPGKNFVIDTTCGLPQIVWAPGRTRLNLNSNRRAIVHCTVVDTSRNITASCNDDPRVVYVNNAQWMSDYETYTMHWEHNKDGITIVAPNGFAIDFDEMTPMLDKVLKVRRLVYSNSYSKILEADDNLRVCLTLMDTGYMPDFVLYADYDRSPDKIIFKARQHGNILGNPVGNGLEMDDFCLSINRFGVLFHRWMELMYRMGESWPEVINVQMDPEMLFWVFNVDK